MKNIKRITLVYYYSILFENEFRIRLVQRQITNVNKGYWFRWPQKSAEKQLIAGNGVIRKYSQRASK